MNLKHKKYKIVILLRFLSMDAYISKRSYRVKISIHYTLFLCIISLLVSTKLIVLFFAVNKHGDSMWFDCFTTEIHELTQNRKPFFAS